MKYPLVVPAEGLTPRQIRHFCKREAEVKTSWGNVYKLIPLFNPNKWWNGQTAPQPDTYKATFATPWAFQGDNGAVYPCYADGRHNDPARGENIREILAPKSKQGEWWPQRNSRKASYNPNGPLNRASRDSFVATLKLVDVDHTRSSAFFVMQDEKGEKFYLKPGHVLQAIKNHPSIASWYTIGKPAEAQLTPWSIRARFGFVNRGGWVRTVILGSA